MPDFFEDFKDAASFSISWLNDGKAWLYAAIIFGLSFINIIASYAAQFAILAGPAAFVAALAAYFAIAILLQLAISFVGAKIVINALGKRGLPAIGTFGIGEFLNLLLLFLLVSVYAVFSLMEIKFLLVLLGVVIFGVLGLAANPVFFILSMLLLFAYYFVIIYNSIRLSMAPLIFLGKGGSKTQCVNDSWAITNGKVLKIFGLFFVYGVAFFVIMLVTLFFVFGLLVPAVIVSANYFSVAVYQIILKDCEAEAKKAG